MKKRKAWNKGTSRLKTNRGYSFYKGSKWTPVALWLGCFVLSIYFYGFGLLSEMLNVWDEVNQAQAYSGVLIVEKEVVKVVKTAKVTAYSCGGLKTDAEIEMNCPSLKGGSPRTANGTTPIANKTMACDPANMGKSFNLEGYGEVVCTDTGGAIKGAGRFDLYVENVAEAYAYGVQYLEYSEVK